MNSALPFSARIESGVRVWTDDLDGPLTFCIDDLHRMGLTPVKISVFEKDSLEAWRIAMNLNINAS